MILLFISTTIKRLSEAGIEIDLETITIALNAVLSRVFNPFVILNKIIGFGANYDFKSFELFFIGLVPSFLYSNKPILSIGNDVGKKLNLINQGNHNTGINPGWIGEGYYNFDLIGVILSGFLFSFLGSYISKKIHLGYDSAKIISFFLLIFIFSGLQMEIAASSNNFIKGIIVITILTSILKRVVFSIK